MKSLYCFSAAPRAAAALFSRLFFLFCFLLTTSRAEALNYYWVNGDGEWGESVTVSFGGGSITHMAHWAKIAVPLVPQDYHTIVPGSSDDVKFDGHNGGTVNVGNNTIAKCHNFNCSGAASAFTLSGGSAERLEIYGNAVLFAGMTMQIEVRFEAIMGGGGTITSSGVHFGGTVYFEGSGSAGGWVLNDPLWVGGTLYHTAAHLDTDGNAVTVGNGFYGNWQGDNSPELTLGASTVTINGDHGLFTYLPLKFHAGTSTIISNSGGWVYGNGYVPFTEFYNVTYNTAAHAGLVYGSILGTLTFHEFGRIHSYFAAGLGVPHLENVIFEKDGYIYNANDYHNLTLTAGHSYTFSHYYNAGYNGIEQTITSGGNITIAGGGGGCAAFMTMKTWQYGDPSGFINNSGGIITLDNLILQDIHATPANSMIANNSLDLGNNTGWNFINTPLPAQRYWVGGDGDWNEQSHWSTTSGGAGGACIPTPNDDVFFDQNSGFTNNGGGVTLTDAAFCKSMDWSAVTGNPFFQGYQKDLFIYGSLTWAPPGQMTLTGYAPIYHFRGVAEVPANVVTSAGQTWLNANVIFEATGTYEFGDAFTGPDCVIHHHNGKLRTMGHDINIYHWMGNWDNFQSVVCSKNAELWLGDPIGGGGSSVVIMDYVNGVHWFKSEYPTARFHAMNSEIKVINGQATVGSWNSGNVQNFWKVTFSNIPIWAYGDLVTSNILDKVSYSGEGKAYLRGYSTNSVNIYEAEILVDAEQIAGSNFYETLTLAGGHRYRFNNGYTHTISATGSLNVVNADCEGMAYLYTFYPNETVYLKKDGIGNLHLNRVILDNIYPDPTPGPTYSAMTSVALQPAVGTAWNLTNPASRNLYWVGGSGNWNESAHWSNNSGGAGGECPPTPVDNVNFNANSGLASASDVVTLGQSWSFCKDMTWSAGTNGAKLDNGLPYLDWQKIDQSLSIFGNLTFSTDMVNDFDGIVYLRTHAGVATSITSAGNHFKGSLHFWDPTGDYALNDDLNVDITCQHEFGKLHSNDHDIYLNLGWYNTGYPSAELWLGNSTMRFLANHPNVGQAYGYFYYVNNQFHAGTSSLIFDNYYTARLYAHSSYEMFYNVTFKAADSYMYGGNIANKLVFEQTGHLISNIWYNGPPTDYIHEAEFWDDFTFNDSRHFHSLKLFPGRFYGIEGTATLAIVPDANTATEGEFIAQGLPGQFINIKSLDINNPATIAMDDIDGDNICTHYLFLTAMEHTGTEDIYVPTPNANIFNNSGWQFFPCNPCPASIPTLAANNITVGCAPGQAQLILAGLLPDEQAHWYTDPAATTNLVYAGGNLFEPLITGPTTYYARVYSDGGLCESTVVLAVDITNNTPPMGIFNVLGGGNVCTGSIGVPVSLDDWELGMTYELYLDGLPTGTTLAGTGNPLSFGLQTVAGAYTIIATPTGTSCPATMSGSAVVTGSLNQAPAVVASSNAPLCVGSGPLQLSEGGGELVNWSWTGPGGFLSTDQNPVILNPTPTNSGVYTVTGSSVNGCSNSQSILVTVHPQPDATITTSAAAQVCPGTTGLTASVPNAGLGATYTWTILNGTITGGQGTNNITYNVDGVGQTVLSVTVVGAGGCSAAGCNNTFIQSLGNMGGSQPNIFPHPNGDFFATGLRNDSMVIIRFDPSGSPLWARAFKLGTNTLLIRDMIVDASGDLIGVAYYETGYAADAKSTVFRYNIATHSFVWVQHVSDVLFNNIHSFDANNCVLTGTGNGGYTQLAQIDKSTGAISTYALQGEGGEYYSVLQNGHLYGACRRYYNSFGDFRASVFSHDAATGAFEWQNSLISEGDALGGPTQTRMYPEKPAIDNDSLLMLASGDLMGFSGYFLGSPQQMVVAKTDLMGNLGWTKQYVVAGYDRPVAARIANTADGYYIVSNLYLPALSNFGFGLLIKTDKQGNVQWAKRLGISGKNIVKNIMERNGFLHLVMASDSYAPDELLLLKLDLQGNSNTTCDFIQPISVTVNHLPKVQNARPYTVSNRTNTLTPLVETPNQTSFSKVARCSTPCSNSLVVNVVQPDAGFISGPISICVDEVGLLTSSGVSGGFWGSSDPTVAQVDANTGHVFGIAPGNCFIGYFVTVNGCSNSVDFPIEVRPLPVLNPVSNSPVCSGGNLEFNETSGNATNWNWFNLNGYYAGGIQNPMIQNVTPANSGTYTVAGTGLNGCTGYADVTVVVSGPASAGTISGNATVCHGKNTPLSIIGTPGGMWSSSNTAVATVNSMTGVVQGIAAGMVVITYTVTANGCTETANFNMEVKPRPAVAISGDNEVCSNEPLILTETGNQAVSWEWTSGSGNIISTAQTLNYPNPTFAEFQGIVYVEVIGANGCTNIWAVDVIVYDPPPSAVSSNAPFCAGSANLQLFETGGAQGVTWLWNGPLGYTSAQQNPVIANPLSGIYTVQVTDFNGCTSQSQLTADIHSLPTVTCPPNPTVGLTDPSFQLAGATPSGGIYSGPNVANGTFDPLAAGIGSHPVAYDYTDGNGCPGSCAFSIVVQNVAPPDIICPADVVKTTDLDQCSAVVTYPLPIATDPGGSPVLTLLSGWPSGSVFPVGTTVIVWQATGISGLTATCSFSVTVSDGQNPSIVCPLNIVRNTDPNFCSAVVTYTSPTFSDNCPGAYLTLTSGLPSGSAFPIGVNMVNWKATDAAGRMAICGFTVTVKDAQAPTITCPKSFAANTTAGRCDAAVTYATPTFGDNCPGAILIPTSGPASGALFLNGATLVTYEARDAATPANISTCSFTVTVNDAELPKPVCPANQSKNTDVDKCNAKVTYAGTFTDNCAGGSLSIQSGLPSGADFPKGVTTVVLKATDATGLTKTCSFKVTVNDAQAPAINCPAAIAKNTDNNLCSAAATYTTPTFTDNCMGGSVVKISGLASGSAFPKGTNVVVWRATDAAGLTKTCSIKVTVTDAQLPSITCPTDIVKNNDPNMCGAATTYPAAAATDNCPGVTATLLSGLASGAVFPVGTSQVIWKVTDAAGLTKTCAFSVQVNDTQAPMLMCPGNTTVNGGGTPCGYPSVQLTGATVMLENCLQFTLTSNAPTNLPPGATVVTWTATDLAGNVSNCAYTVTVGCTTAPSGGESRSKEVGLRTAADGLDLTIAPNPAISQVTLRLEGLGASGGELMIFDPLGRMVWRRALESVDQQVILDVSGPEFPQGLYQVRLKTTEGMVTKGLVVMKL